MKKLILFVFLTTLLNANSYEFIVENATVAESYFNTFNAMGGILSGTIYQQILKFIFLLGGFSVFTMGVFRINNGADGKQSISSFFKYMIAGTFLMILVIGGQRDQLVVTTKTKSTSYCTDIKIEAANTYAYTVSLPGILPQVFSLFNKMGRETTNLATTAYQVISPDPDVLESFSSLANGSFSKQLSAPQIFSSIDQNSYIGMSKNVATTVQSTSYGELSAAAVVRLTDNFLQQCIYPTLSSYNPTGLRLSEAVGYTSDLYSTLNDFYNKLEVNVYKDTSTNNKTTIYKAQPESTQLLYELNGRYDTCQNAWNQLFKPAYDKVEKQELYCLVPNAVDITPASLYTMTKSTTDLGSLNRLVTQSAMLNILDKSSSKYASFDYAQSKTMAEESIQKAASGLYMAQMLPYLQMGIRAVLYAFFPFVFLTMLLPGGFVVITNYLRTLLWVELWSPVAAILNMILAMFATDTLSKTFIDNGLNLHSGFNLLSDSVMLSGVAGYLLISVPPLTWLIVKGSGKMLERFGQGFAASYSKNLNSASIRKDYADMTRYNSFQKHSNNAFISRAEQLKLDTLQAGIEGGAMGRAVKASGGIESFEKGMQNVISQREVRKMSYANNTTIEAEAASGAKDALTELNGFISSGIIKNDGSVNAAKIDYLSKTIGIDSAADMRRSAETISYIAQKSGANLNTNEGISKVSSIMGMSKSALFKGEIAEQESKARQYAAANDIKINGKNANDATFEEVMSFAATVEQDMSSQKGIKEVVQNEVIESILEGQGISAGVKGSQTEINENAKFNEKVQRATDTLNRNTNSVNDIADKNVSAITKGITAWKEFATQFNNADLIKAATIVSKLQAESNIWNLKSETVYRNKMLAGNHGYEHEAASKVFAEGQMSGKREIIHLATLGKFDEFTEGKIAGLLETMYLFSYFNEEHREHKKRNKNKVKQRKQAKKLKKLQAQLDKETNLEKREKLKVKVEQVKADLKATSVKVNPNMDVNTDPQKIADQLNQKNLKNMAKDALEHGKGLVKGGVIVYLTDEAANAIYENTEDGSVLKVAAGTVKHFDDTVGTGLAGSYHTVKLASGYIMGDKELINESLADLQDDSAELDKVGQGFADTLYNFYSKKFGDGVLVKRVYHEDGSSTNVIYQTQKTGKDKILSIYDEDKFGNQIHINVEKVSKLVLQNNKFDQEFIDNLELWK